MKKYISLLILVIGVFVANAQTKPTEVTPDARVYEPTYVNIWSQDTLTNADTSNFVFRVKGTEALSFKVGLYSDHVSGTAGGTLIGYYSYDGTNYFSMGDTITVSSLTSDAFDSEELEYNDFNYPYMKLTYIQTGTAVTVQIPYVYAKYK